MGRLACAGPVLSKLLSGGTPWERGCDRRDGMYLASTGRYHEKAHTNTGKITDLQTGRGDEYRTEDLPECAYMGESGDRRRGQRHCRYQN
jgi:hypothetical protein